MAKSRSFGTEITRGPAGARKGPVGDMILDLYSDVDTGFKAVEAEIDARDAVVTIDTAKLGFYGTAAIAKQDVSAGSGTLLVDILDALDALGLVNKTA